MPTATTRRLDVMMAGPSLDVRGGIAELEGTLLNSELGQRVALTHLVTHVDGSMARKAGVGMLAYGAFLNRCRVRRPDLLHVHLSSHTSFYRKAALVSMARRMGVPVLLHLNASDLEEFVASSRVHAAAVRRVFDRAAAIAVVSQSWARVVAKLTSNPRIGVVPNPVAVDRFAPAAGNDRPPPATPTVLFLGRIGERKGTDDLLDAAARVAIDHPRVRFVLAGDGELDGARQRARRLGIEALISLPGWVRGEAKLELLRRADVYALPTFREGLPVALLEAMAAGLPVVSTPVAGIPDAVEDGVNGFLVPPGDVAALADAIATLLGDQGQRQAMGARNRERARERFDVSVVAAQLEAIYRSLV